MEGERSPWFRMRRGTWWYIAAVTMCAMLGFILGAPWPILLAAAVSLPSSLVTVPGYYVVYGLLAFFPGANPSGSSGSGSVDASGNVISSVTTGLPATWFTITTAVLGTLALTLGSVINVLLLQMLTAQRRRRAAAAARH